MSDARYQNLQEAFHAVRAACAQQSRRAVIPAILLALGMIAAGCGGGGGSSDPVASARQPQSTSTSTSVATGSITTVGRVLRTTVNAPVAFDLNPSDPDSIVHTSWVEPGRGTIAFVGLRFAGAYVPPLGYQGTATFNAEVERDDGRIERTEFTVEVDAAEPRQHPWSCPTAVQSEESVVRVAAHPSIANQLVALRRNGMALEAMRSDDGGASWMAGETLPVAQVDVLRFEAASDGLVVAAEGDVLWFSADGGLNWQMDAEGAFEPSISTAPYYLEGNRLLRASPDGSNPYLIATGTSDFVRLVTDPTNDRRIYVLGSDGLYTLFHDGLPGFDPLVEGVVMVPIPTGIEEPLRDITVDADGKILLAGMSQIYCVEGDRPYQAGDSEEPIDMEVTQVMGEARLLVTLPAASESTELTVWMKGARILGGQPGVVMDAPTPIDERIILAGEQGTLEIPLAVSGAGVYEVAVVLRTTSGITGRGQRTFLVGDPFVGSAGAELALDVTSLEEGSDSWHFQARVANTGLQAAEAVSLHIVESGNGRVQLAEVRSGGSCRPGSGATRCLLSSPLGAGSEAIIDFFVGGPPGYVPALDVMVVAAGDELYLADNVWSWNSNLPKSDLAISSQHLRSRPLEGVEALFRLEVMNEGQQPVAARVDGLLERSTLPIDHGDWVVVAEGGECVMPAQYCALGACGETLSARQRYHCTFDAPLMPAESRGITVSLRAADVGQSILNVAVVSGGSETSSGDNLTAMEIRIGDELAPSPSYPQPDDQCYGNLLLIAFGCVPGSG